MTLADNIVAEAQGEIGTHESPMGSNRGGCEEYQRVFGSFFVGLAWCGCFVGAIWKRAGVADALTIASPSTQVMCDRARANNHVGTPRPGAAFVKCGVHTGLLVEHLGGSLWRTIEGNSGDAVRERVRDIAGLTIVVPPGLSESKPKPPAAKLYLRDPTPHALRSEAFKTKAAREANIRNLSADWRNRLSRWKSAKGYGYNIGPKAVYGPFATAAARKKARARLEALHGHAFVPFRVAPGSPPAKPDADGKTT